MPDSVNTQADAEVQGAADAFIARWQGIAASELSTSQSFLTDVCRLFGVDTPHATVDQDCMFERPITFARGDGSTGAGRINLYHRAFVLESKVLRQGARTKDFDYTMLRARSMAEGYASALPATEGRPPFQVVVDVGHRIALADLRQPETTRAAQPDTSMRMLARLWRDMDSGCFSALIAGDLLRINGKIFKQRDPLPRNTAQLTLLIESARTDWKYVEPSLFGTLLERAFSPRERHKLGAHYTPRANVERLVLPAVIEPLHKEWGEAQAAAMTLAAEGKPNDAVKELRRFHHRLCNVRVLDSACGSDNFLYFTLEHLKRLSSRVGRVRAERHALFENFSIFMSALSLQMPALRQLDPLSIVQEFSALELIPEWM